MEYTLKYVVIQEEDAFVARCLDIEVTSDGPTEVLAVEALKEALTLYFEGHANVLENSPFRLERRKQGSHD